MSAQTVAQTIQLILAPVVMITACAFISNGLLNRFMRINDRMRLFARERFDLIKSAAQDTALRDDNFFRFRLVEVDRQLPSLIRRHELLRNSLLFIYCALATFIIDMMVIGMSALLSAPLLATVALIVFLLGTVLVLVATLLEIIEVIRSHDGLRVEVETIAQLPFTDKTL